MDFEMDNQPKKQFLLLFKIEKTKPFNVIIKNLNELSNKKTFLNR